MVRTRNEDWERFVNTMTKEEKKRFENLKAKFKQLIGRHFVDLGNGEEFVITKVGTRYVQFLSETTNETYALRIDEFYKVDFGDWVEV